MLHVEHINIYNIIIYVYFATYILNSKNKILCGLPSSLGRPEVRVSPPSLDQPRAIARSGSLWRHQPAFFGVRRWPPLGPLGKRPNSRTPKARLRRVSTGWGLCEGPAAPCRRQGRQRLGFRLPGPVGLGSIPWSLRRPGRGLAGELECPRHAALSC